MGYASVYRITLAGDVEPFEDVRNASAGAPFIWSILSQKVGLRKYFDEDKLWPLFGSGRFTRAEDLCLGFTYDGVYVRNEHIPELAQALEDFHWKYCDGIVPTIMRMAAALRKLFDVPETRGACFRMTSVAEHPWRLYTRDEHGERIEDEESRPFNFDRDRVNAYNAEVFELVDELDRKYNDRA